MGRLRYYQETLLFFLTVLLLMAAGLSWFRSHEPVIAPLILVSAENQPT